MVRMKDDRLPKEMRQRRKKVPENEEDVRTV